MGCGLTKPKGDKTEQPRKRSDTARLSVDDLKSKLLDEYKHVQKRFGHPSYYKNDGYELGLRVDGFERAQSLYVATSYASSKKVTVKEHHLGNTTESDVIQEILILANLSHKALPEMCEVFITDASVFSVTTLIDSSRLSHLLDLRPNHPTDLSMLDIKIIFRTILEATAHCHSKNIIVRNLTPSNISVKKTPEGFKVKIADFSLAVMNGCTDYVCDSRFFNWNQVPYMAPEALLGNAYSYPMDMWAVGVLLYMMVCNCLPFYSEEDTVLMNQISNAIYEYPKNVTVPSSVKNLISQLLFVSVDMRLTVKEALNNAWLNEISEIPDCDDTSASSRHK